MKTQGISFGMLHLTEEQKAVHYLQSRGFLFERPFKCVPINFLIEYPIEVERAIAVLTEDFGWATMANNKMELL